MAIPRRCSPASPRSFGQARRWLLRCITRPSRRRCAITFTYKLINAAANVLFVVAGADKAAALREVLRGPVDVARLPAQGVRPKQGALVWLVDAAAAKEL